jgi:hypothetical protein
MIGLPCGGVCAGRRTKLLWNVWKLSASIARWREGIMLDYLAVAFRHPTGSWAAVMPDFIGITGRGSDASAAIQKAKAGARAMLGVLKESSASMPVPMDIRTAQRNVTLTRHYGVDWSHAVVDTLSFDDEHDIAGPQALIEPETRTSDRLGASG